MSGAQHGTSGNSSDRLRQIAARTQTTKANVATALQMISWGLEVNDYGNAQLDAEGGFIKVEGEGVTEEMWAEMVAYADEKGWKKGDYKNLNLPFESRFLAQPAEIRERMARRVEDFVYKMMTDVLNGGDTAPLAIEAILEAGSYDLGPKVGRIEDPRRAGPTRRSSSGPRRSTPTRAPPATSTTKHRSGLAWGAPRGAPHTDARRRRPPRRPPRSESLSRAAARRVGRLKTRRPAISAADVLSRFHQRAVGLRPAALAPPDLPLAPLAQGAEVERHHVDPLRLAGLEHARVATAALRVEGDRVDERGVAVLLAATGLFRGAA